MYLVRQMPRKKSQDEVEPKTGITNWYEKIPKELLDNTPNPNFHLHKIALPFRLCCVAPSGSGKSNFLINLIHLFSQGTFGTFASIFLCVRNKDEPLYRFLTSKSDQIQIKEGLEHLPALDKFDKDVAHLVCFDDLVLAKNQSAIENYYIRARKLNVSVCYLSQSYFAIPKMIRSNCNYMVILKLQGEREVNMILKEWGMGVTKEQLLKMYQYATAEKFSPLIVDLDKPPEERFRKGFLEILDPKNYA
jgi:hypothetical protein